MKMMMTIQMMTLKTMQKKNKSVNRCYFQPSIWILCLFVWTHKMVIMNMNYNDKYETIKIAMHDPIHNETKTDRIHKTINQYFACGLARIVLFLHCSLLILFAVEHLKNFFVSTNIKSYKWIFWCSTFKSNC